MDEHYPISGSPESIKTEERQMYLSVGAGIPSSSPWIPTL
jgi:hypothetical protein